MTAVSTIATFSCNYDKQTVWQCAAEIAMGHLKLIVWKCAAQCHARIITLVSKRSLSIKQETLLPQQIAQAFFRTPLFADHARHRDDSSQLAIHMHCCCAHTV